MEFLENCNEIDMTEILEEEFKEWFYILEETEFQFGEFKFGLYSLDFLLWSRIQFLELELVIKMLCMMKDD
jgi:hypothetical protein